MRKITTSEMLQVRELLLMETTALAKAKAIQPLITDNDLKAFASSGIQAGEARIRGIQQCINENITIVEGVN